MPFELNTAIDFDSNKGVIPTTSFDINTAGEASSVEENNKDRLFFQNPPKQNFIDTIKSKIGEFFRESPQDSIAKAHSIYAISKVNNIPMEEVEKHIDTLQRDPRMTGIRPDTMTNEEYIGMVSAPLIGHALIAAPVATAIGIAGFTAVDKMFNLNKFVPADASNTTKTTVQLADYIVKGGFVGGVMAAGEKTGAKMANVMFSRLIDGMEPHFQFQIKPEQIKSMQASNLPVDVKSSMVDILGINENHIEASLKSNTPIAIPPEKIFDLAKEPYWDQVKEVLAPEIKTKPESIEQLLVNYESAVSKGDVNKIQQIDSKLQEKMGDLTPEEYHAILGEAVKKEAAVPEFQNPDEAKAFGKSATPEQINDLKNHYVKLKGLGEALRNKGDITDTEAQIGFHIGEQLSRVRESLVATGKSEAYRGIFSEKRAAGVRNQGNIQNVPRETSKVPDLMKIRTKEAYDYGNSIKDNPEAIKAVLAKNKELNANVEKLKKNPNLTDEQLQQYADSAHQIQMTNEIIEALPVEKGGTKDAGKREAINKQINKSQEVVPPQEPPVSAQELPPGAPEVRTRGLSKGVEEKAIEKKLTEGLGNLPEYEVVNMKEQAKKASDIISQDYEQAKRIAMGQDPVPQGVLPESVFVAVENRALAEGDINTLRDLATNSTLTTEATTMGQRIRTLAERNPESPIKAIQELQRAREERFFKEQERAANKGKIGRLVEKMGKIIEESLSPARKSAKELRKDKLNLTKADREKTKALVDQMSKEIYKELKSEKIKVVSEIRAEIKKVNTKENWDSFIKSLEC